MINEKKTEETETKREKELKNLVENLESKLHKIEEVTKLKKKIQDKKQAIEEDLQKQLIDQNKFGKQFDDMIEDYLYFVELKERLKHDIDMNGIRYKTTGGNGFATFKANESVERLQKTNGQMLKILQDLDLKAPDEGGEDGNELL